MTDIVIVRTEVMNGRPMCATKTHSLVSKRLERMGTIFIIGSCIEISVYWRVCMSMMDYVTAVTVRISSIDYSF